MVGSAAIKQGRSANRKHTYFFFGLITIFAHARYGYSLYFLSKQKILTKHLLQRKKQT